MELSSAQVLLTVLVGFVSGILSALAGVGGAVVTTPGVRALGASPIIAVGSTVPAVIPGAVTGTLRYHREGLVDWRIGRWCGLAGAAAALIGAWLAGSTDARWLMVITAGLVLWSSGSLIAGYRRTPTPTPTATPTAAPVPLRSAASVGSHASPARTTLAPEQTADMPAAGGLVAIGLGAGFLAGLLGVGGGIVLVPAFTGLLRLDVKRAVATSLVAVAMMSVASLVGHLATGHIDWAYALPLAIGVVPGARLGSRITVATPERTMRLVCGLLLGALGLVYLSTELIELFELF